MTTKSVFRMTIDLPIEDHKRLKTLSALSSKPMRDIIVEALGIFYKIEEKKSNNPNAETRKVLDEIKRGKDLIKCDSVDDLFKKIGI